MWLGRAAVSDNSQLEALINCCRHSTEPPTFKQTNCLKGKLGDFFLLDQSFYRPQTKTRLKRQFPPKSPEVGQKSGQRVKNSRNMRATVGIHLLLVGGFLQ